MQGGVEAAAKAVEAALRDAGFGLVRRDKTGGLTDIFGLSPEDVAALREPFTAWSRT